MNDDFEPGIFGQLAESFNEGGAMMYPLTALGCLLPLLAIGFLIAGTISTRNRALPLAIALLLLAVLPPALGTFAARSSRVQVEAVLANVAPEDRETIKAAAESELMNLTLAGMGGALIPSLLGCVLLGMGLGRLDRFRPQPA